MICRTCKQDKSNSEFRVRSDNGKMRKQCHKCHQQRRTVTRHTWDEDKKNKQRDKQLKYLYGISLEDYNNMFKSQEGKCAICFKHQMELVQKLCVDHCHKTGKIRGLLCTTCNYALGAIKENPEYVLSMLKYIEKYGE